MTASSWPSSLTSRMGASARSVGLFAKDVIISRPRPAASSAAGLKH
jgi:hypothetical protein